jgi:hypothetical protein
MNKGHFFIPALLLLCTVALDGQESKGTKLGITSEQNLQALVNPSLYSTTSGFDGRYEGVKGSPRLMDTVVPSTLTIKGQDESFSVATDIDLVKNTMLFILKSSGDLLEVSSGYIDKLVFHMDGKDLVFRTTGGLTFDKEIQENKFYQILREGAWMFIKIPVREFSEANYTGLYSPDKRYDEYVPADKYYIMDSDSVFHRVLMTRKSLTKMFPGKKELIESNFNEKTAVDPEAAVTSLLNKF